MIYTDQILGQSRKLEVVGQGSTYLHQMTPYLAASQGSRKPEVFGPRSNYVQHRTPYLDALHGNRQVRMVKSWRRMKPLGYGSFGAVFPEECIEAGEWRVVKDILKNSASQIDINPKEEQRAFECVGKVRDMKDFRVMDLPSEPS